MTYYDSQQVRVLESLRFRVTVHRPVPQVQLDWIKADLVDRLVSYAATYALDVDERDVALYNDSGTEHFADVLAAWHPQTKEVRLLGGPKDGEVYVVPDQREIRLFTGVGTLLDMTGTGPAKIQFAETVYRKWGWDPEARQWLWTAGPPHTPRGVPL